MAEQTPNPDGSSSGPASSPGGATAAPTAAAMATEALQSAQRAASTLAADTGAAAPLNLPSFGASAGATHPASGLDLLSEVDLHVKVELGRTRMLVEDVLRLAPDSVIELDKLAGDPVDIYVNDHPVARGEVLVVNDNFCVRVSEIVHDGRGRASDLEGEAQSSEP